jgi:hypothetical protein
MRSGAHARRLQRRLDLVVQRMRAADEGLVDRAGTRRRKLADLVAVQPAHVQRRIDLLAREHRVQRQPRQVAVLQVFQLFLEHRRGRVAVAVQQRHAAGRLLRQHGLDDRQDRRDAAAAGDASSGGRRPAGQRGAEAALRLHHLSVSPAFSVSCSQVEKAPPGTRRTPTRRPRRCGADRVRAAQVLPPRGRSVRYWPGWKRKVSRSAAGTSKVTTHRASSVSGAPRARAGDGSAGRSSGPVLRSA